LIVEYLPKGSPELSAVEQYWRRQGKDDLLVSKYYPRFTNLKTAAITDYYRTKRFKLDIAKYLMRESANLC
jgi:transposase